MKQKFSSKWKASKKARKQRKYRYNAPLHLRHKLMAGNLSKELRKKYSKRAFPIRKGDSVKVMRGKFRGKTGKINEVDLKRLKVGIDGIQVQKKDGTKVNIYFNPSNLQIQELNLDDKERLKVIKGENKEKEGRAVSDIKENKNNEEIRRKKNVSEKK